MIEDRFDDQLREAARDYNAAPETPRDEMWERIVAERAAGQADRRTDGQVDNAVRPLVRTIRPSNRPAVRLLRWPLGIAAVMALGIGLGRMTAPTQNSPAPTT